MWQMRWLRANAGPGPSFHRAGERNRPRLRPEALHGRDAPALWRVDRRLEGREFVADALSVADFAILGWAWRHPRHKVELKDFPNVERWYNALMARPATKRGMEAKLD